MMIGYGASGTTHDFFCYNSAGQVWNGAAFVTWADADYASYRVTATEVGTSGRFTGTAPSGAELYELRVTGASLALSYVVWTDTTLVLTSARLAKIDLIGTGAPINGTAPVSTTGTIDEIIIGDDYSTANGNAFSWTVTLPTGATIDGASCFFGGKHSDPSLADDNSWLIEGEVSAGPTASQAVITFNLLRSHTDGLIPGDYNWSAEIRNDSGLESTRVRSKKTRRVALVEKYT